MFSAAEETPPVQESGFTPTEIQELWSLLQVGEPITSKLGSIRSDRTVSLIDDERKRKRMKSNRESARRSRLRKKKHLENLMLEMNRLEIENRGLKNRLSLVSNRFHMIRKQNEPLRSEYVALYARLSDLYRILPAPVPMQRVSLENSCMQI